VFVTIINMRLSLLTDHAPLVCLFVCLLFNGTSTLFRLLVPRTVEIKTAKICLKRFVTDKFNI